MAAFAGSFLLGWLFSWRFRASSANELASPQGSVLPSYRGALPSMSRELARVRRYDRSLAVLVLKPQDSRDADAPAPSFGVVSANGNGDSNGNGDARPEFGSSADHDPLLKAAGQVAFWNLGYALRDLVRESDVSACDISNRRYVVLLPDAGEELASVAGKRIQHRLGEALQIGLRAGVAVYRQDGLTIDDLVLVADARCDRVGVRPPVQISRERRPRFRRIADTRS